MKKLGILIMIVFMAFVTACTNTPKESKEQNEETSQAEDNSDDTQNQIQVVTSFYPMYILALNVTDGVENVQVTNMAKPQVGCLHDYQLSTEDMKILNDANLFIMNGAGMEGFVDKILQSYPELEVADTSQGTHFIEVADTAHESTKGNDLDGYNDEQYNSHIWLSIPNAVKQVENMRDALCRIDPDHEEQYKKNAEIFADNMNALTKEMRSFDVAEKGKAVVFHEGFDYIGEDAGFTIPFGIYTDGNVKPSAKELRDAVEQSKEKGITIFFAAEDNGKEFAETIANEVGGKVYVLDPITSGEENKDAYAQAMRKNISTLKEALDK